MCLDHPLVVKKSSNLSQLFSKYGDHLTHLKMYNSLKNSKKDISSSERNSLIFVQKVFAQLLSCIRRLELNVKLNDINNEENILKSLLFGYKSCLAKIDASKAFYRHVRDFS